MEMWIELGVGCGVGYEHSGDFWTAGGTGVQGALCTIIHDGSCLPERGVRGAWAERS